MSCYSFKYFNMYLIAQINFEPLWDIALTCPHLVYHWEIDSPRPIGNRLERMLGDSLSFLQAFIWSPWLRPATI